VSDDHHEAIPVGREVREVGALLEERGLVTRSDVDSILDSLGTPANGARVVARASRDSGFRTRLVEDGNAAVAELGFSMDRDPQPQLLRVVENTASVHNVVVCTLCSRYPIARLGPSPAWYKSDAYRSRIVRAPRSVLREFGLDLPADVEIACGMPARRPATWCCRCVQRTQTGCRRTVSPRSSRAAASSAPPPSDMAMCGLDAAIEGAGGPRVRDPVVEETQSASTFRPLTPETGASER
jgi:nitrile hydratase